MPEDGVALSNLLKTSFASCKSLANYETISKSRFRAKIAEGHSQVLTLVAGRTADKAAEAVLSAYLDQDRREAFYQFFAELEDLYEILSPDAFLREFMDDYRRLADVYALLRAAYESTDRPGGHDLARKTAKTAYLVQAHTQSGVIRDAVTVYEITPNTLDRIAQSNQTDTVKVFNLIKSIEQKVADEAAGAPYLLSIGERAETIAEAFKQRQVSTQEALQQLEEQVRAINDAQREQAQRGITGEPFAIFWLLKQEGVGVPEAEVIARGMAGALDKHPHWRISERESRAVRLELYRLLDGAAVSSVPQMVERILRTLRGERC